MRRGPYFSTILSDTGGLLLLASPVTGIPLLVALFFQEYDLLLPLLTVPVGFAATGTVLSHLPRSAREARFSAALCTIAVIWLLCAVISTIPFVIYLKMSFTDSLFESMAGWTGTGLTMMTGLESLPRGLLFWRTFMQWLGGLGVIALTSAIANRSALFSSPLLRAESRSEALIPSMFITGRQLGSLYLIFTMIAVPLLMISGISLWEALNLGLSTISTGGFCIHDAGILYFSDPLLEGLLIPVMIMGAVPFTLLFLMVIRRRVSLFGDEQVKVFLFLLLGGAVIITTDLWLLGGFTPAEALRQGVFTTVAAVTSTGLQNSNPHLWPGATVVILILLVFVGGCAGSTAGGIKVYRVAMAYRGFLWWFRRTFVSSRVIIPFRFERSAISEKVAEPEIAKNMLVIILSVLLICASLLVVLQFHLTMYEPAEVVLELVSAFASCGITTGFVSPSMPLLSKWVFIGVMWIGRLEVVPVLVLAVGLFRGPEG